MVFLENLHRKRHAHLKVAMKKTLRPIGAHVSAAGGPEKAVGRASEIGADAVQIFSGSPRVWKRSPLAELKPDKVFSEQERLLVKPLFLHSIYLVNLSSDKPELVTKSRDVIAYDLAYGSMLNAAGVVVHLGSHQGRGWDAVRDGLAREITTLLAEAPANAKLLIENSAGQNGKLCSELSEIRWLLDVVSSPKLGWCLDTCHAFAAGYYLGERAPEEEVAKERLVAQSLEDAIEEHRLWDTLKCIHVNDSKDPFASGRDRHENLGDGTIPVEDLRRFLRLQKSAQIPLITEVPGLTGDGPDKENIARLRALAAVE
jgi:deoxyribonuclease-4